jgi:hypothetical protein
MNRTRRLARAVADLLRGRDAAVALGLLAVVVIVWPPRGLGQLLTVSMIALLIVLVGIGLHAARALSRPGGPLSGCGAWVRGALALGFCGSVLMVFSAALAVFD